MLALAGSFLLSVFEFSTLDKASLIFVLFNLFIAGVVAGGLIYILWKRRRIAAESLLLDAGRNVDSTRLLIGGLIILQLLLGLLSSMLKDEPVVEKISGDAASAVLLGSLLAVLMIPGFAKVYLTEEGISLFRLTLIKWDRIHDYTWSFRKKNKVILLLKGGKQVAFVINGKCKDQVEEILHTRVKGRTTS
jgi:hypothetical protein